MTPRKWKILYSRNAQSEFITTTAVDEPNIFQAAEILQQELFPNHVVIHLQGSNRKSAISLLEKNGISITSIVPA